MGWGVFAARPFRKGEIVELAPGMIPLQIHSPAIKDSALDDYVYGYYRLMFSQGRPSLLPMYAVMFGMGMIFNHHPTAPNLEYTTYGREPAPDVPNTANAIGFVASRDIMPGEELFSTYDNERIDQITPPDQGDRDWWFTQRNISLVQPLGAERRIASTPSELEQWQTQFCSKSVAGMDRSTWTERIVPILPPSYQLPFWMNPKWLPPSSMVNDTTVSKHSLSTGFTEVGLARAKVPILANERVEVGTALILSSKHHFRIANISVALGLPTSRQELSLPLLPLVIPYQDLTVSNQQVLQKLRQEGNLKVQVNEHNEREGTWKRTDYADNQLSDWNDIVLLPIGGNVGLMHREYELASPTNCRLVVWSHHARDSVSVALEIVATQPIAVGEVLRIDFSHASTPNGNGVSSLQEELRTLGRVPSSGRFATSSKKGNGNRDEL
eukprot:Nitzschia sp. Nitz4//scaffold104_size75438//12131//13450//NITZ4_005651-RA/size75438-processed-gene-0.40-mRNA-1//-1//CDS//3329532371//384//frame0